MTIIGRKDRVDLPDFGLSDIAAKIDTGAYGCTLHCHYFEIVNKEGKEVLAFKLLDPIHPKYIDKVFYAENFSDKLVKNSSGKAEHRYVIKVNVIVFDEKKALSFSLTNRKKMKYPVLLGRKFLSGRFIVDVKLKDLSFKLKKRKK
jgi:hypothetical protein